MKNIFIPTAMLKDLFKIPSYIILLLLFLMSCKKELTESPKSVAAENFYNTAAEVETAVNAIYVPLRDYTFPLYYATLECHSDFTYGRGSFAQMSDFQGFNSVNITRVAAFWSSFYLSIRNANFVIKNAPNGKSISQDDVKRYVAEAKFMRALNYFQLVRNWGGVPIHIETNIDIRDVKRSTSTEVYNLITADLIDAETNLPDAAPQIGRPTKWAAKTMLADVYLQTGKFVEASDKANEVIVSNKYSLVSVATTNEFQKIFGPEVQNTPEEIFYLKYTRQASQGNYMVNLTNHPSTGLFNFGGAYVNYSKNDNPAYTGWDNADLRKGMWMLVNFGLGSNTLVTSKYQDKLAVASSRLDGAGTDLPLYRYSDLLLIYAEAANAAGSGPTPQAMEAVNKVHRRAYGYNPATASPVDFNIADYTATTFLDLVIRERGYEFQEEGKRWLELKRTGKAAQIILAVKNITIVPKHFLWPIPAEELSLNKALDPNTDQNPGY